MSFFKIQQEDRRFHILNFLKNEPDFALNHYLLQKALKLMGHGVDPDLILSDIQWLETQGLVTTHETGSFTIAKLTGRGLSVADQDVIVPGISRTIMG